MTKQLSQHAAAAHQIRRELKSQGVEATVRARTFSGGDAVDVILYDPLPATVEKVEAFARQYQYGSFDGMQDLYEYTNRRDDLPQVKYVQVHTRYSDEIREAVEAYAAEMGLDPWLIFSNQYPNNFWTSRKPRITAAA